MTDWPRDPIAAVIHPDPYPFYTVLARDRPWCRDETLGLWVAASAKAVTAVLTSPLCRVRPPGEPVPKALLGSAAGEVFRHLVRMNDGEGQCAFKHAISATLAAVDTAVAKQEGSRWARVLSKPLADGSLTRLQFDLPVYVMGSLTGLPDAMLPQLALLVGELVRCLAPVSTPAEIERGKAAAAELLDLFRSSLAGASGSGLLAVLAHEAERAGRVDLDAVAANGIGFLTQAYEATAGLIGSVVLALARDPGLRERVRNDPQALPGIIGEVVRLDPSIQNTRRWVAAAGVIAGQAVAAGDAILVVLAAANRDSSANPDPNLFNPARQGRRSFTFGAGVHACPGETLATTIAEAAAEQVLASGLDLGLLAGSVVYRASANARVPPL